MRAVCWNGTNEWRVCPPHGLTDEQTLFLSDIFNRRKGVLYGDARDPARRMARISG